MVTIFNAKLYRWNTFVHFVSDTEEASESEIAKGDEEYTELKEQWV